VSKVYGEVAESWTVSPDGKTFTFKIRQNKKFASGNPLTAEDVAFSLQRAVLLDKSPAFILGQFGFTKDNVKDKIKQTGPFELTMELDKALRPELRPLLPDLHRRLRRRQEARDAEREGRRHGLWLAQDQVCRIGPLCRSATGRRTRSSSWSATRTTTRRRRSPG
jgi:MarR-like DNA-binding transcriptional regulator SgrR of sgrS sRNA